MDDLSRHSYAPFVTEGQWSSLVLYDEEPDPQRYEEHAELCSKRARRHVPPRTVFGAPMGEPPHRYYAEWELPDLDAFKAADPQRGVRWRRARTRMSAGVPPRVEFAELD